MQKYLSYFELSNSGTRSHSRKEQAGLIISDPQKVFGTMNLCYCNYTVINSWNEVQTYPKVKDRC